MNLVQIINQGKRAVAIVDKDQLLLLKEVASIFELASRAIKEQTKLATLCQSLISEESISYNEVYEGRSSWKLLPSFDHPDDPRFMMCSGTGLTHKASAENRQKMHDASENESLTDSMKIYQWGLDGGKPDEGKIGTQPEWFFKGNGSILRAHGENLHVPNYGNDGGEEPEIAACYVNDENGNPYRIGFTTANEFSDHVMEKKNYLYLAPSKIRNCSIGPEFVIIDEVSSLEGEVRVERAGEVLWSSKIKTGEDNMAHSLANLEYHHFKYTNHHDANGAHLHFLGADAFSFGAGVALKENDVMIVHWKGFGRALKNSLEIDVSEEKLVKVKSL